MSIEWLWHNESFSKVEKNYDNFLEWLNNQENIIKEVRNLEQKDRKNDEKETPLHEQFFDWKITYEELQEQLKVLNTKEQPNQHKISWNISEVSEKEKIIIYWILSNLAYSEFKTITEPWEAETKKLSIKSVKLDPLSFPNIDKIFDTPKPQNLTAEEQVLYWYIQENKEKNIDNTNLQIASDIKDILRFSKFEDWTNKYAKLDDKYRDTLTDVIPNSYLKVDINKQNQAKLITKGLEHLKKEKIVENWKILEQLNWEFEIVDYFPNENNKNDLQRNSWFWAICLKDKEWNTYFAIRWTELKDWWDLVADIGLVFKRIPEDQTKDMVDFVDRNIKNLDPKEKFRVLWHSLGWALTQILTSIYKDRIDESYTFNSPWAKDLKVEAIEKTGNYFAKFESFEYNKNSNQTWELITNVAWTSWLGFTSNLWEDIWNYKVDLEWLSSHSIVELIKHVENMDEKDVVKQRIKFIEFLNKKIKK